MSETVKITSKDGTVEREVVRYVDISAGCCVIRVHGFDDRDPKDSWRWINIDLLSSHDLRPTWRKRIAYAWNMIRYGFAQREFIEFIRSDETDAFIDAVQVARAAAFGTEDA